MDSLWENIELLIYFNFCILFLKKLILKNPRNWILNLFDFVINTN